MKRLLTFCACLMLSVAVYAEEAATVTPETLLERVEKEDPSLVVLDVRTPEEYQAGHVPHARNIPHDQLESRLSELADARDKDVVVYCRSGRRAGTALEILKKHGYSRAVHLKGDMPGWEEKKMPVERE